jgi:hypothetical protein
MQPGNRSDAGKQLAEPGAEPPGRQSHPVAQALRSGPNQQNTPRFVLSILSIGKAKTMNWIAEAAMPTMLVSSRIGEIRQMHAQRNDRRGNLTLAIVAAFVALVSQAAILFDDFGTGNNSQGSGSARMVTAAAVFKAGAIEAWPQQDREANPHVGRWAGHPDASNQIGMRRLGKLIP